MFKNKQFKILLFYWILIFFNEVALEEAVELYREAGSLYHGPALCALGRCHEFNIGIPGNITEKERLEVALACYEEASEVGEAEALFHQGRFAETHSNKEMHQYAFNFYYRSVELGYKQAIAKVGYCYELGIGKKQNYIKAKEYYDLALENDKTDKFAIARRENPEFYYSLAVCYSTGLDTEIKNATAFSWCKKAADSERSSNTNSNSTIAMAQNLLGNFYSKAIGCEADPYKAVEYYKKSASNGDHWGQFNLATCYERAYGGLQGGFASALYWYSESADKGNDKALLRLGIFKGCPRFTLPQASAEPFKPPKHLEILQGSF